MEVIWIAAILINTDTGYVGTNWEGGPARCSRRNMSTMRLPAGPLPRLWETGKHGKDVENPFTNRMGNGNSKQELGEAFV